MMKIRKTIYSQTKTIVTYLKSIVRGKG